MTERAFVAEFLEEADELLLVAQRGLLALLKDPEPRLRREIGDEVFRAAHTLKGLCGMVELKAGVRLTHALESTLMRLREGSLPTQPRLLDACLEATRKLGEVIGTLRNDAPPPDISASLAQLAEWAGGVDHEGRPPLVEMLPDPVRRLLKPDDLEDLERAGASGQALALITFSPTPTLVASGVNVNAVRQALGEQGTILKAVPLVSGSSVSFAFLFAAAAEADPADLDACRLEGVTIEWLQAASLPVVSALVAEDMSGYFAGRGRAREQTRSVRVDTARLNELTLLLGDLSVDRARLHAQLEAQPAAQQLSARLERGLKGVREAVIRVRMVPLTEAFERMPLVVRELARAGGRSVDVELRGGETQIDKATVEHLLDPLLHLVRNAVTHGLETPLERERAGKPAVGKLILEGRPEGDAVTISVSDDGRGLDAARILARAGRAGQAASPEELLDILCRPGFSTREEVDEGAGRGVGMDVVRQALDQMSGSLSVAFQPGGGTCFTVRVPVTLAVLHAFLIEVGGERYMVARDSVDEVLELDRRRLTRHGNRELLSHRQQALPVVRLGPLLGVEDVPDACGFVLVHNSLGGGRAVVVDRVLGLHEVVVRPMRDPLVARPWFSGATELPDGSLALIPHLPRLLATA